MENTVRKPPAAGKGRPKGAKNKTTRILQDALLEAAELAGGPEGTVGYLRVQATANPNGFMALLGKVIPLQIKGPGPNGEHGLTITWKPRSPTKSENNSGATTTPKRDGASS